MSEFSAADKWIYATLKADAQLTALIGGASAPRIYADVAPQGAPFPYVVFSIQASVDLMTVGPRRVWSDLLYWVRGIAETTSYGGALATIETRIEATLHARSGSSVDGVILAAVRTRPNRLPEVADGRNYRHSGGIYRLYAQVT